MNIPFTDYFSTHDPLRDVNPLEDVQHTFDAFPTSNDIPSADAFMELSQKWMPSILHSRELRQHYYNYAHDNYPEIEDRWKKSVFEAWNTERAQLKRYSNDETGMMYRFADDYCKDRAIYTDRWYIYDETDGRWKSDGAWAEINKRFRAFAAKMRDTVSADSPKEYATTVKRLGQAHTQNDILAQAKSECYFDAKNFDPPHLLNCKNGVLILDEFDEKGNVRFVEHRPDFMLTQSTNCNFVRNAPRPTLEKFIDEIFLGDSVTIAFVQMALGFALLGEPQKERLFFILWGEGGNGKSLFNEVVGEVLGSYACVLNPSTILDNRMQANTKGFSTIRLKGKRFCRISELPRGAVLDEQMVKELTGTRLMVGSRKGADEEEFVQRAVFFLDCNTLPIIRENDRAIKSRIRVIPFDYNVPDEKMDANLREKLLAEADGIFAWIVEGFEAWLAYCKYEDDEGNHPLQLHCKGVLSQRMRDILRDYLGIADPLRMFVDERIVIGDVDFKTRTGELYDAYCDFEIEHKRVPIDYDPFMRELRERFNVLRRADGMYAIGVRLKVGEEHTDIPLERAE